MAAARILICDDVGGYRLLTKRWLEDAGFDVVGEAASWSEAETLAGELQPDAVVADLWMPEPDLEALKSLRTAAPDAAIVSLSGLPTAEAEKVAGPAGVIDLFLSKESSPADIAEAIRGLTAGS